MPEAKLSKEIRTFIVTELAMFELPSVVKRLVKENYSIDVELPAIIHYDGSKAGCPKKWKTLFDEIRKQFIEDQASIPIAQKSVRLRELNRLLETQKRRPDNQRNPADMRATLELAAKEVGNVFTNRQEHTGKGGKDLIPNNPQVVVYLPDNGRPDIE